MTWLEEKVAAEQELRAVEIKLKEIEKRGLVECPHPKGWEHDGSIFCSTCSQVWRLNSPDLPLKFRT